MLMTPRASLISLYIDLGLFKGLALVCAVSWLFTEVTGDSRTTVAGCGGGEYSCITTRTLRTSSSL